MRKPRSVSELLAKGQPALERLKGGAEAANRLLVALQRTLPADVAGHVFGASVDADGVLIVLVDSGAFATRVRYLLAEQEATLADALGVAGLRGRVVRVRPRG
jgi:hypothetical protein